MSEMAEMADDDHLGWELDQLDKLKRDEQKAEEECKRLQQLIDNGGIPLPTPAPGKKKKK